MAGESSGAEAGAVRGAGKVRLCWWLEEAGFAEAVPAAAGGVGVGVAEDDVVEELDLDGVGGGGELAGDLEVGGAGLRVAGGVVVGDDDAGGGASDGFAEDFARVAEAGGGGAGGGFDALDEAEFGVEAEDPEFLDFEACGMGVEVTGDEVGAVE